MGSVNGSGCVRVFPALGFEVHVLSASKIPLWAPLEYKMVK